LNDLSEKLNCFENEKNEKKKARTANISICKSRAGHWNISYVQTSAVVRADEFQFGF